MGISPPELMMWTFVCIFLGVILACFISVGCTPPKIKNRYEKRYDDWLRHDYRKKRDLIQKIKRIVFTNEDCMEVHEQLIDLFEHKENNWKEPKKEINK